MLVPGLLKFTSTSCWLGLRRTPKRGLKTAPFNVPSAAVVGGSMIGGMFFDRGAASNYDAWRDLNNLDGGWGGTCYRVSIRYAVARMTSSLHYARPP